MEQNSSNKTSFWQSLWQPSRRWYFLWLPLGGIFTIVLGVLGAVGFNGALSKTNENSFCFSCHIGMDTVVEEYQASVHYKNTSGVGPGCADCHVPKEFFPKLLVKLRATKDIYHKLVGTYNLENFEGHRLELAQNVWTYMQANDSRECRNCHKPERWDLEAQPARARTNHNPSIWAERQETCIDCHYGIAHRRPTIE